MPEAPPLSVLLPALCVGVESLFGACGVDVVQLLLLFGLAVFIFLHLTRVLHVGPVSRQNHQVVDLKSETSGRVTFKRIPLAVT